MFSVVPDELDALSRRLVHIHDALDRLRYDNLSAADIGARCLVDAVGDLTGNWSDARSDLIRTMQAIGGGLTQASYTYREVDQAIARATGG